MDDATTLTAQAFLADLSDEDRDLLARFATEVLNKCHATHPDRSNISCNQARHINGHLYHRNSDLGVEWWTGDDQNTMTHHDVLGPIQLLHTPAGVEIRMPFIGDSIDSESGQEPHRGRYHLLPPEDNWFPGAGVGVDDDWFPVTPPGVNPDDDGREVTAPSPADADRAVYRDLLPIVGDAAAFLDALARRYRDGKSRMGIVTCHGAERHRDLLRDLTRILKDLVDGIAD